MNFVLCSKIICVRVNPWKTRKKIKKEKIVIARIMTNVRIEVKRISDSIYTETTKNKHGT